MVSPHEQHTPRGGPGHVIFPSMCVTLNLEESPVECCYNIISKLSGQSRFQDSQGSQGSQGSQESSCQVLSISFLGHQCWTVP